MALAVRVVVEDGLPYRAASWHLWRDHRVFVPFATIQNWVEVGGERASDRWETEYLAFFQRFQAVLQARQLTVRGITTDGSIRFMEAPSTRPWRPLVQPAM